MYEINRNGIRLLKFNNLSSYDNVEHFVSMRSGGCSKSPFDSLNVALHVGDIYGNVVKNRIILADSLGLPHENLVFANQTHSDRVAVVNQKMRGRGFHSLDDAIPDTDALITDQRNICLIVMTADCTPVLLFDPVTGVIGAVHAGRNGVISRIPAKTCLKMNEQFNCKLENIIVSLGPALSAPRHEINDAIAQDAIDKLGFNELFIQYIDNKPHFSMENGIIAQLTEIGVKNENIETSNYCTYNSSDMFFSSRKDKGISGRFATGIMIN